MNVVRKKNPKKGDAKPSFPVVNCGFTKPKEFLKHFTAAKKPSLLSSTYQEYSPNIQYESAMVDRGSLHAASSAIPGSSQSSRKVSFGGNIHEARTTTSSSSYRPELPSPLSTVTNARSSKPTSSDFRTPSLSHDRNFGTLGNIFSSSRSKGRKSTPKSTSSATTITSNQSRVIVAITEGRGNARGEVGLAAMDVRHPCLIFSQLSDTHSYHNTVAKLNVLNPSVVLFPNTIVDNQKSSKLFQTIERKFPNAALKSLPRKFYNDEEGMSSVKSLHLPECVSIELIVVRKYFTLAAAAALVKYVEYIENVTLASGSVPMEYQAIDKMMMIDFDTMNHLELIISQSNCSFSLSLYSLLNYCYTFGGKRRLRSDILQPSFVQDDLNNRLDCITELVENTELRQNIQNALAKIPDIESLLKICFVPATRKADDSSITMLNYVILMKTTLDVIPSLHEILTQTKTKYFLKVTKCLDDPRLKEIAFEIDKLIDKDTKRVRGYAASQFQRCFAIKQDINGLLDVARYTYSELISEFQTKVAELAETYELPLKCQSTSTKGFHIQLSVKGQQGFRLENLPKVFIQAQRNKNMVTMTTEELIFINERIAQALQEVQLMSNALLQELLQKIREITGCLYNLCDNVSELDLIVSLSRVSSSDGYIRPVFGKKLILKSARHPILDFTSPSVPVGNDVTATDLNNFHIITGPNMGGKTIYIKQIALIQIMAQIGCYVPAQEAEVKLMDHLFSRISFNDSIECNESHFTLELTEMSHIVQSATKSSLVIIDEFCRGTSADEGTAIAWAISEIFIHSSVYAFFATHFHFLTRLQDLYVKVSCWYFDGEVYTPEGCSRPRIRYTHKLLPGVVNIEHYGLKLAESTVLPDCMKEAAYKLAESLSKTKEQSLNWHLSEETKKEIAADRLSFKLMEMADNEQLTLESLEEAIAECNISEILGSENEENDLEESVGVNSQEDSNADIVNLDSPCSENNNSTCDPSDLGEERNTAYSETYDDTKLLVPQYEEESFCPPVKSNALESLKLYESFTDSGTDLDDALISKYQTADTGHQINATHEGKGEYFSAGGNISTRLEDNEMNLDCFEKRKTNLDDTTKTIDFSYSGFVTVNTQTICSTPINSLNWSSQRLNESSASVCNKLQERSEFDFSKSEQQSETLKCGSVVQSSFIDRALTRRNVDSTPGQYNGFSENRSLDLGKKDQENDHSLHSSVKRPKKTLTDQISASRSILLHYDKTRTTPIHTPTPVHTPTAGTAKRGHFSSNALTVESVLTEDSKVHGVKEQGVASNIETPENGNSLLSTNITQNLRSVESRQWRSTTLSPNSERNETEFSSFEKSQSCRSSYCEYSKELRNLTSAEQKDFSEYKKLEPKPNTRKDSQFNDSNSSTTKSNRVYTYSRPNLKPKLHDISWETAYSPQPGSTHPKWENNDNPNSVNPSMMYDQQRSQIFQNNHTLEDPPQLIQPKNEFFLQPQQPSRKTPFDSFAFDSQNSINLDTICANDDTLTKFQDEKANMSMRSAEDSSFDFCKALNNISAPLEQTDYGLSEAYHIFNKQFHNFSRKCPSAMREQSEYSLFQTQTKAEKSEAFPHPNVMHNFKPMNVFQPHPQSYIEQNSLLSCETLPNPGASTSPMPYRSSSSCLQQMILSEYDDLQEIYSRPHSNVTSTDFLNKNSSPMSIDSFILSQETSMLLKDTENTTSQF